MRFKMHACLLLLENIKMKKTKWSWRDGSMMLEHGFYHPQSGGSKITVQKSLAAILPMTRAVYHQISSGTGLVTSLVIPPVFFLPPAVSAHCDLTVD